MYKLKEFVTDDDYPNIESIMVINNAVNMHDRDAVIAAFAVQDEDFNENDIAIDLWIFEVASSTVKPVSLEWNP